MLHNLFFERLRLIFDYMYENIINTLFAHMDLTVH